MRHFLSSLVNSGQVTVLTSLTMTALNASSFTFTTWVVNWVISWSIVFTYVYFVASKVTQFIIKHIKE